MLVTVPRTLNGVPSAIALASGNADSGSSRKTSANIMPIMPSALTHSAVAIIQLSCMANRGAVLIQILADQKTVIVMMMDGRITRKTRESAKNI